MPEPTGRRAADYTCLILLAAMAGGGCAARAVPREALPADDVMQWQQLVVHSDFELPRQHRLLDELVAQRDDIAVKLAIPVSNEPIHVHLFDTPERFHQFIRTHYPGFPDRRAFFVETDTRLAVYAHWGDRIAEDLRHEVSHGYLHAVLPNLPLWLDEGLAEYFEVPRGRAGMNRPHVSHLLRLVKENRWRPDLVRLEAIATPAQLTQQDYAESWAWIHFLLETTPERADVLRNHLARLRMTGTAPPLSAVLARHDQELERQLLEYLESLR